MKDIEEVFEMYDYSIVKSDIKPIHQRNFSDLKEKEQTIGILHKMEIDTKNQRLGKPFVFADLKSGLGVKKVIEYVFNLGGL